MKSLEDIAGNDSVRTPCYVYDMELLDRTLNAMRSAASKHGICVNYALKANCEDEILQKIASCGIGADCVSGNEVLRAYGCGFAKTGIFFAGVGKSDREIVRALDCGAPYFIVESLQELEVLNSIASQRGTDVNVLLRINPEVDAHTHKFITTGTLINKFGIAMNDLEAALELLNRLPRIKMQGLHSHIGSQINRMDVFALQCEKMNMLVKRVLAAGFDCHLVGLGGGLGVDYEEPDQNPVPDFESWFSTIDASLERTPGMKVFVEPGRSLVAQCGTLLSRVLFVKHNPACNFMILDAGMNDLVRPALYGVSHKIENLSALEREPEGFEQYEIVGPVCESSDVFAHDCRLPVAKRGDMVAIRSAGAYGATMSSRYNLKDLAETLYV
ncbi:MAG: diaminopimelate decarboxylase [Bacteroidales bacterium]|nr:diaminopimelate decarboxylase [Bacteroidales bacterium]